MIHVKIVSDFFKLIFEKLKFRILKFSSHKITSFYVIPGAVLHVLIKVNEPSLLIKKNTAWLKNDEIYFLKIAYCDTIQRQPL